MIRKSKGLGLALVAVLALSAIAAGSASAAFESEIAGTTTLTPSGNNNQAFKYSTFSQTVFCKTVGGSGLVFGAFGEELEISPVPSGCTVSLGPTVDPKMNGCKFVFTSAKGSTSASMHIVCPGTSVIETIVTEPSGTSFCTYTIGSQTPGGSITLSNTGVGTTREVDITFSLTGIVATRDGSSICGPAASTSGTYSGQVVMTGESGGSHVGIWTD